MIAFFIIVCVTIIFLFVVHKGFIHVDLSMPWLVALVTFGFLSTNDGFVDWVGEKLGILYPPIAIVFITIAILLGLITVLLIVVTRLRLRQMQIIRRLATLELAPQEQTIRAQDGGALRRDMPNGFEVEC